MTAAGVTHRVGVGETVTLSSILTTPDGLALPDYPVVLQVRGPRQWQPVAQTTTDATGAATAVTPPITRSARFRWHTDHRINSTRWLVRMVPTLSATADVGGDDHDDHGDQRRRPPRRPRAGAAPGRPPGLARAERGPRRERRGEPHDRHAATSRGVRRPAAADAGAHGDAHQGGGRPAGSGLGRHRGVRHPGGGRRLPDGLGRGARSRRFRAAGTDDPAAGARAEALVRRRVGDDLGRRRRRPRDPRRPAYGPLPAARRQRRPQRSGAGGDGARRSTPPPVRTAPRPTSSPPPSAASPAIAPYS